MSWGGGEARVNGAVFLEPQAVQEMKPDCFSAILTAHIYTAHKNLLVLTVQPFSTLTLTASTLVATLFL